MTGPLWGLQRPVILPPPLIMTVLEGGNVPSWVYVLVEGRGVSPLVAGRRMVGKA